MKGRPDLVFERPSEEHGVLVWSQSVPPPRVGERLEVIPNHICPVVNLHEAAYGLRGGQVERVIVTDGRGRSR